MYKVKICGVTDCSCVDVLNKFTPDYVGFILSPGYGRSISLERAKGIRDKLNSSIICTGVFVNEKIDRIVCAVENGIIGAVQLHGSETEEYIEELKARVSAAVIKRIAVGGSCPKNCDFALIDGTARKDAPAAPLQLREYNEVKKPYFIAGGLTPQNVAKYLKATNAYGADCSGGVETDGKKDGKKIEAFIKNAREVLL